jgi:hypothetical protein
MSRVRNDDNPQTPAAAGHNDEQAAADMLSQLRSLLDNDDTPEDIRRLLNGPGQPSDILRQLIESGVILDPEESIAELINDFEALLESDASPLDAELAGAELLALATQEVEAGEPTELLTTLVEQVVAENPEPLALAVLRSVAATVAQPEVRAAATAAADRLVAGGIPDPHWVATIGNPTVGQCFGFRDAVEHTVVAEFHYGDEPHAFAVHIDNSLGGGIRDIWVTDEPEELLADFRSDPEEYGSETSHSPADAYAILERALREEPCPVEPDEIDDVDIHLELLRRRVSLLANADPAGA